MTDRVLSPDDDLLALIDQSGDEPRPSIDLTHERWRVLVVDDDDEVHRATAFALGQRPILGRPVELVHARSATEARGILEVDREFAAAIIDVVMEHERAGLDLVVAIRERLRLSNLRIILRTGQPGFAPELEAVTQYDINDYQPKLEVTRDRLIAVLTTALRTYQQLSQMTANRVALEAVARLTPRILAEETTSSLLTTFVGAIRELVPLCEHAAVAKRSRLEVPGMSPSWIVATGTGRFAQQRGQVLATLMDDAGTESVDYATRTGEPHGSMGRRIVPIQPGMLLLCVEASTPLQSHQDAILDVACGTLRAALTSVESRERLVRIANTDATTGLPSRVAFESTLAGLHSSEGKNLAVVVVDLERFEDVRDTVGSATADQLIVAAAERLANLVGPIVQKGRVNASTVGCIVSDLRVTTDRILAAFEEPLRVAGYSMRASVVVGVATARAAESCGIDVLAAASLALSSARKSESRRARSFERYLLDQTRARLSYLESLRTAVSRSEFELHYQPQVDMIHGTCLGVEALVRWRRRSGEIVAPLTFIELAEQSGLIVPIGEWVLREACRQLRSWDSAGLPEMKMAVNVSVAQFHEPGFVESVARAIRDHGVDPARLELELTESVGQHELLVTRDVMNDVVALGVSWALDDFGVGYSSLGYLRSLPISCLKIDRLFTAAIRNQTEGVTLPKAIIQLSRELGYRVVAEGVETPDVARILYDLGCRVGQGFLYSKPVIAKELEPLLIGGPTRPFVTA